MIRTAALLLLYCSFSFAEEVKPFIIKTVPLSDTIMPVEHWDTSSGFTAYIPENIPKDICHLEKILVMKSSFDWEKTERATLNIYPIDHPCRVYVNNQLIYEFGLLKNPYIAVNYKSNITSIPESLLKKQGNRLIMLVFPRGERTPPPIVSVDTYKNNSQREFYQTLLNYTFVSAFWVIGIFLFLLFITFWLASKRDKKEYLYFALCSLFVSTAYTNVIWAAPLHYEPLLWVISRSSFVAASALMMTFISFHAGTEYRFRWVNRLFLTAAFLFFCYIVTLPTKDAISHAYAWASSFLITPAMFFILGHSIAKFIRSRSPFEFLIVLGVLTSFATGFYDLWFVQHNKIPYFWTLIYGYAILEIGIVLVLSRDLWRIFNENHLRALLLKENLDELEIQKSKIAEISSGKSRFLRNMAHEFKTPLQGLMTISELLQKKDADTESLNDIMSALNIQMQRHLYNIQNVMDLSILEDASPEISSRTFGKAGFFNAIERFFHHNESNHLHRLKISISPSVPDQLNGPSDHISRIILNLAANIVPAELESVIFCSADWDDLRSELSCAIQCSGGAIRQSTLNILQSNSLSVMKNHTDGSSAGNLAVLVAVRLVPLLGGTIKTNRESGEIVLTFPLHRVSEEQHHRESPGKILIAEDNESNRLLISKILTREGYSVITAEDGLEAVEKAESENPSIILMDVQMPLMNGIEASKLIRKTNKSVVIIAFTANAGKEECIKAGMNDYLSKPAQIEEISKKISEYMAS